MRPALIKRNREATCVAAHRPGWVLGRAGFGHRLAGRLLALVVVMLLAETLATSALYAQRLVIGSRRQDDRFELSKEIQIEDDDIREVRPHLARANALADNAGWDEAIETFRKIVADHGDKVVQISDRRYISVRDYCHLQIARMPSEAISLYRDRVDASAQQWLREGIAERDSDRLSRVVKTLFCSSYGDEALDALAQIALERGEYGKARRYWELISPQLRTAEGQSVWAGLYGYDLDLQWDELRDQFETPRQVPDWLVYPDSNLDLATIRARLVLVSILEGSPDRAAFELDVFRRLHQGVEGRLAGRRGPYEAILAKLLSDSQTWPRVADRDSPEFSPGGTGDPYGSPRSTFVSGKPLWHQPLVHVGRNTGKGKGGLAFFPLVVDGAVFYSNSNAVFGFHTRDGRPLWQSADASPSPGEFFAYIKNTSRNPERSYLSLDAPRFTMTAHKRKVFARLGKRRIPPGGGSQSYKQSSFLFSFDTEREGALRWKIPRDDKFERFASEQWVFEGTPVADDSSVYVGMRRGQLWSEAYVACFDAETGQLRWRTKICEADSIYETAGNLVTLHEGVVYYNTNLGSVAALEADSGSVRWIYRYERAAGGRKLSPAPHFLRGPNPCLYHDGLVIVAPSDCESIVAIDAVTGRRTWQTVPLAARHLLGVGRGNLIATGRSVWWINALTGKLEAEWPGRGNKTSPRGYGQGVLAGDAIFWPTAGEIIVFDQQLGPGRAPRRRQGLSLRQPDLNQQLEGPITAGNLAVSRDALLLATKNKLVAFPWIGSEPSESAERDTRE